MAVSINAGKKIWTHKNPKSSEKIRLNKKYSVFSISYTLYTGVTNFIIGFYGISTKVIILPLYFYYHPHCCPCLKNFIIFFREGKGEKKRGRETSTCALYWGPGMCPRLGIGPATL